ncbi:MAG: hypothetical protein M1459_01080 [Patescibacteria group bacterium]|nr:hypothetical protein [Patescibacteria group bacterium]
MIESTDIIVADTYDSLSANGLPYNPAGTSVLTPGVMMGLNIPFHCRNSRGIFRILAGGSVANSIAGDGATLGFVYNAGVAPVNGAAIPNNSVAVGPTVSVISAVAGQSFPWSFAGIGFVGPGATPNLINIEQVFWIDLNLFAVTGGVATVTNAWVQISEILR